MAMATDRKPLVEPRSIPLWQLTDSKPKISLQQVRANTAITTGDCEMNWPATASLAGQPTSAQFVVSSIPHPSPYRLLEMGGKILCECGLTAFPGPNAPLSSMKEITKDTLLYTMLPCSTASRSCSYWSPVEQVREFG